jgi:hypothetical protein
MKRTLITALLPLAATSLIVAGGASPSGADDASTNVGCALPTAERSYTRDMLSYRLAVDVTDCDWWDGTPVQLEAGIERVDPTEGHGVSSFVLCGVGRVLSETPASDSEGADSNESSSRSLADDEPATGEAKALPKAEEPAPIRSGACAVEVSIEHPSPEVAHYTGEITFPWQGERRTVSFNALCGGNAAGCVDLPVDPMTTLAPIGDAIAGIGGDGNVG